MIAEYSPIRARGPPMRNSSMQKRLPPVDTVNDTADAGAGNAVEAVSTRARGVRPRGQHSDVAHPGTQGLPEPPRSSEQPGSPITDVETPLIAFVLPRDFCASRGNLSLAEAR